MLRRIKPQRKNPLQSSTSRMPTNSSATDEPSAQSTSDMYKPFFDDPVKTYEYYNFLPDARDDLKDNDDVASRRANRVTVFS
ncbi:unnamed protein product [Acanthoscelides obtectus]|uniref:Uncharacterized protein n=1 Tax=Acanthoscelides obtectus TaxID=200917 RepID=A0A9P0MFR4_ACAOB|nr:unnamed protein product [Acanthoscelides obtectus]